MEVRKISHLRTIFLFLIYPLFFISNLLADSEFTKILTDKKPAFDAIETFKIHYSWDLAQKNLILHYEIDFTWDRGKYLIEVERTGPNIKIPEKGSSAYDGELYQMGEDGERRPVRISKSKFPDGLVPVDLLTGYLPLTFPYTPFLVEKDGITGFQKQSSYDKMLALLNNSWKVEGSESPNEIKAVHLNKVKAEEGKEFPVWTLIFDKSIGMLKLQKIENLKEGTGQEYKLSDFESLNLESFKIFVPLKIEGHTDSKFGPSDTIIKVKKGSIVFNEKIDPKKFNITTNATDIFDVDDNNKRLFPLPFTDKIYDETIDGKEQIKTAIQSAKAEGKNIFVLIGNNQCAPCHKLHKFMKENQEVAAELKKSFVTVMFSDSYEKNQRLLSEWENPGANGVPVIVVLNGEGKKLITHDTDSLISDKNYEPKKVLEFLNQWNTPTQ